MPDTTPAFTRIAMWSGPRNISTALMRSFENRPDTIVWDEPYYAAELAASGHDHPMRDAVIAAGPTDPASIVARLLAPPSDLGAATVRIFYQKHMTHHMLPVFDRSWIDCVTSAFLIRAPERVLASYTRTWSEVSLTAIGLPQQREIFDRVADRLGRAPPVIDADDLLANPEGLLRALCAACGIAFLPAMLRWPPGPRASDGVWSPAWYDNVERSTGFNPPETRPLPALEGELAAIAETARPIYEHLAAHRLRGSASRHRP